MDWRLAATAVVALVVGLGIGSVVTDGREADSAPSPAATVSPAAAADPTVPQADAAPQAGLPEPCLSALALGSEVARFTPEALTRLRVAYQTQEQSEDGTRQGPPPEAVFSQLQAEAQGMASQFSRAKAACEDSN